MALSVMGEFALSGDRGIDVFRRIDDERHRRHRYECIATVMPETDSVEGFSSYARQNPDKMRHAARAFIGNGFLSQPICLGVPSSYPKAGAAESTLQLFLYIDFFRSWHIADQEIARVERTMAEARPLRPVDVSRVLKLLLDFNRLKRAAPFIQAVWPVLIQAAAQRVDDRWQNNGFALRIVGDLQRRSGHPDRALAAYEGALSLGMNPHRCGLAIQAAHEAGNVDAVRRHLTAFEEHWPLPETLSGIKAANETTTIGGPN